MLIVYTVLTAVLYPLVVTLIGGVAFANQANGSMITVGGKPVGSSLIAQPFTSDKYFWSRPSAVNYGIATDSNGKPESDDQGNAVLAASGASNKGPTAADLQQQVKDRADAIRKANSLAADAPIPSDLLFASGSGLDPHISPDAAKLQVARVAKARGLDPVKVSALVDQYTDGPQFGLFGDPRVNVLNLNIALDQVK
jgi:K+-transporting ATPase ATPase C chain